MVVAWWWWWWWFLCFRFWFCCHCFECVCVRVCVLGFDLFLFLSLKLCLIISCSVSPSYGFYGTAESHPTPQQLWKTVFINILYTDLLSDSESRESKAWRVCVCVCVRVRVCVCVVCVHCVCVCCHKRLLESTEWVSMYVCGVRLYGKLQLYTRAPYVCAFEYSDTVNWCMVVWCTQKLCRNGSSFTLHQPFKGSVKAVSGHKITPNRFKTTYRSVLTFKEKKQSITYLFKTFSGLD